QPQEVKPRDVDLLKNGLMKTYAPDTVISVVSLLRRIANYGADKQLCPGLTFRIKLDDKKLKRRIRTETLTREQWIIYKRKCRTWGRKHDNRQIGNLCQFVLETGIRRGTAQNLKWDDVDLEGGFIRLRDMKSGGDEVNPISLKALAILRNHRETHSEPGSKYVFSGRDRDNKGRLSDRELRDGVGRIRDAAALPLVDGKPFRPLHGLRHARASKWADEGKPLYHIQRLLNHATPGQTARYSHLGDDALRRTLNGNGRKEG
ncbi:MAG: site-specific integrase, partial [Candidatus Deferrimicrobiaceae bacterium]